VETYFLPYLNVAKFCKEGAVAGGCFEKLQWQLLNKTKTASLSATTPALLLSDGSVMIFSFMNNCITNNARCLALTVDINGSSKPNIIGYDYFTYNFSPHYNAFNGVCSYDVNTGKLVFPTQEEIYAKCQSTSDGFSCAPRIIADGFRINY